MHYHQSGNSITGAVFPIWEISRGNLPGQGVSYPGAFLMTIGMLWWWGVSMNTFNSKKDIVIGCDDRSYTDKHHSLINFFAKL